MTRAFQQLDLKARLCRTRVPSGPVAIQLPFFFDKRFLATARRSRTISKSSLPSQNSITSLAKAIRCSTWKLNGRPRRRHISSSSARCSSDMRMLYWSVFLATLEACQTGIFNSWGNVIYNGMQCYTLRHEAVSETSRERSGRHKETCGRIQAGEMNLTKPPAGVKEESSSRWQTTNTHDNLGLECSLSGLMTGTASFPRWLQNTLKGCRLNVRPSTRKRKQKETS